MEYFIVIDGGRLSRRGALYTGPVKPDILNYMKYGGNENGQ
jgi:hypothetical protein